MADAHEQAVRDALRAVGQLGVLFAGIGSYAHPRSGIFAAYVRARRALTGNLGNRTVTAQALAELRAEVIRVARRQFSRATEMGLERAARDLGRYSLVLQGVSTTPAEEAALQGTLQVVDNQIAAINSGLLPESRILGDAGRVGLLAPGLATRTATEWLARLVNDSWQESIERALTGADDEFVKQAIAAIDERTTDCCLQVHTQVQPMDQDYVLTGTPRYADRLPRPPFHDYCRTSQALVLRSLAGDSLTTDMRRAADVEIRLRKRDDYKPPHPASALTRVRRKGIRG